jgi:Ca2+-binding EF-hand superfamily protein
MFRESELLDRTFRAFDRNNDGYICFAEFLECLSAFSNKSSQESKIRCN